MIDLTRVRTLLAEVGELIDDLDGVDLDETQAITAQTKGRKRQLKAQRSQDLQMLATRFELAASLVRVEYWHARGEQDPLDPSRELVGDDSD